VGTKRPAYIEELTMAGGLLMPLAIFSVVASLLAAGAILWGSAFGISL
jgi:hypothetical protein